MSKATEWLLWANATVIGSLFFLILAVDEANIFEA